MSLASLTKHSVPVAQPGLEPVQQGCWLVGGRGQALHLRQVGLEERLDVGHAEGKETGGRGEN